MRFCVQWHFSKKVGCSIYGRSWHTMLYIIQKSVWKVDLLELELFETTATKLRMPVWRRSEHVHRWLQGCKETLNLAPPSNCATVILIQSLFTCFYFIVWSRMSFHRQSQRIVPSCLKTPKNSQLYGRNSYLLPNTSG